MPFASVLRQPIPTQTHYQQRAPVHPRSSALGAQLTNILRTLRVAETQKREKRAEELARIVSVQQFD